MRADKTSAREDQRDKSGSEGEPAGVGEESEERQQAKCGSSKNQMKQRKGKIPVEGDSGGYRSERKKERLLKPHTTLVVRRDQILKKVRGDLDGVEVLSFHADRNREIQKVKISQNYKGLVRAIIRVIPAGAIIRVEKVGHKPIRIERRLSRCRLKNTGALKLGEALQFIAGKTTQEVKNRMTIRRSGVAEESTNQRIS